METLFGISQYSATEFKSETSIETIALKHEYIIKRIKCEGGNGNWSYDYIILDKKLEPCVIERKGWSLGKFASYSAWVPKEIHVNFKDPNNQSLLDFKQNNETSSNLQKLTTAIGLGVSGLNTLLDIFFNASNSKNWQALLKSTETVLIEPTNQDLAIEIKKEKEFQSLKEQVEILKQENEELKEKLEQLRTIIG